MKHTHVRLIFFLGFMQALSMERPEAAEPRKERLIVHLSDVRDRKISALQVVRQNSLMMSEDFPDAWNKRGRQLYQREFVFEDQKKIIINQLLYQAVREGNLAVLQWLVEKGGDINYVNRETQDSLIQAAAIGGYTNIIEWLVEKGVTMDCTTIVGQQLIHLAAYHGGLDLVQWLLEKDVDINCLNWLLQNPLSLAVAGGHVELAKWLVQHGANISWTLHNGMQLVHLAASQGHSSIVEWLLAIGASIDSQDLRGLKPAHYAAANGQVEVMEWLRDHGADLVALSKEGHHIVHTAAMFGQHIMMEWLAINGFDLGLVDNEGNQPSHLAARYGHLNVLQWLVSHGVSMSALNLIGDQPVHCAAQYGQLEALEGLVRSLGVDSRAKNHAGNQPLHSAASNNRLKVVQWLVESGVDGNAVNNLGETAIHHAALNGHLSIVSFLHGGDITTRSINPLIRRLWGRELPGTTEGNHYIHYAARGGHVDVINWLARVESTDRSVRFYVNSAINKEGDEPIHIAASNGHLAAVQFMVNNKYYYDSNQRALESALTNGHLNVARFLRKQYVDWSYDLSERIPHALHNVAQKGYLDLIQWLVLERGVDVAVLNDSGQQATHMAALHNQDDVLKFLTSPTNIDSTDSNKARLMTIALQLNNLEIVEWLILHGAASLPGVQNAYKDKPLMSAALSQNQEELMKELLTEGIDVTEFNRVFPFLIAHHLIPLQEIPDHLKKQLKPQALSNALDVAAITNQIDVFKALYAMAFEQLNDEPHNFVAILESSLYWAAAHGSEDIVHYIIGQAFRDGRAVNLPLSRAGRYIRNLLKRNKSLVEQKDAPLPRIAQLLAQMTRLQMSIGVRSRPTVARPATTPSDAFARLAALIPNAPDELIAFMMSHVLDIRQTATGTCTLI